MEVLKMGKETDMMVVLKTGKSDRGASATLAFGWACTALALGKKVTMFLTMDGTIWSLKDSCKGVKVEGFDPLNEYVDQFFSLGGKMLICAPCTEYYCSIPKELRSREIYQEAELAGLSTIVSMVGNGTSMASF
jgi:uncharacterized protein involved in oxidation of intracellular sulfur